MRHTHTQRFHRVELRQTREDKAQRDRKGEEEREKEEERNTCDKADGSATLFLSFHILINFASVE